VTEWTHTSKQNNRGRVDSTVQRYPQNKSAY